jgi:hypothetical protein
VTCKPGKNEIDREEEQQKLFSTKQRCLSVDFDLNRVKSTTIYPSKETNLKSSFQIEIVICNLACFLVVVVAIVVINEYLCMYELIRRVQK